jgi:hypothetical protein
MEVVSVCPFRVASLLWQPRRGGWVLTVVCKATYDLAPVQARLSDEQDDPNEDDNHWNDDPARSLYSPSDLVPFKARADVVLVGHAFATRGEPARSIMTRLVVGTINKSIEAYCDRSIGPDGAVREGAVITKMPLRYERAAGGPETGNPVGVRADVLDPYGGSVVPNLQPPGMIVQSRAEVIPPVGYGPIAPTWLDRVAKLGPYAASWSHRGYTEQPLPDDFDPGYFNCAPIDQQLDELRDNERIILENLHPQHPRLVTSLPGMHPRAFVLRPGAKPQDLPLRCDTLWIDTDRSKCTVTWRSQIALDRPHALGRVVIALEEPGQRMTWGDVERKLAAMGQQSILDEPTSEDGPKTTRPVESTPPKPASTPTVLPAVQSVPQRASTLPFAPQNRPASVRPPSEGAGAFARMNAATPRRDSNGGLPFVAAPNAQPPSSTPAPAAADLPPPGDAAPAWLNPGRTSPPSQSIPSASLTAGTPFAPATPQPPPAMAPPPAPPAMAPPPAPPAMAPPPPPPPPVAAPIDSPWASGAARSPDATPAPTMGAMAASMAAPKAPASPLPTSPAIAMAAAGLAGAGAVAAFSAASPAPPPPANVAGAATSGALAASNAAAIASQWAPPPDTSVPAPAPVSSISARSSGLRGGTRDVIDLLWYEPEAVGKLREDPRFKPILKELEPTSKKGLDLDFDDDVPPPEPPEVKDRRDVFAVITRGDTSDAEGIHESIADAVADDGTFTPPLVLAYGELTFPFDELETLKATVTAVTPLIAGDKKLKETVDTVNELLKTPWLQSSSGVAEGLTQRVKEAFAQGSRTLPPSYLDTHTERMLLEQRHYQRRTVFGEVWIRSLLTVAGASAPMPAYLPESLSKKLPMFQRFKARLLAEAHMQQDEYETQPAALKVVALGRVVSLQRRGFRGA